MIDLVLQPFCFYSSAVIHLYHLRRSHSSSALALVIVFVLVSPVDLCLRARAIEKLLHLRYGAGAGE